MINAIFNILENNNIKEFKEIKNLKWNQIVKLISEVNDIDSATKKLYLDTIKDLIWVNTKKQLTNKREISPLFFNYNK